MLTSILCFLYVAGVLAFSYSQKKKFDAIVPQMLTGKYQYLDTILTGDVDTSLYYPKLRLFPRGTFTFDSTGDPDSLVKGTWYVKTYERFVNLNDKNGRVMWTPEWDTSRNKIDLIFKEEGRNVVYRMLK